MNQTSDRQAFRNDHKHLNILIHFGRVFFALYGILLIATVATFVREIQFRDPLERERGLLQIPHRSETMVRVMIQFAGHGWNYHSSRRWHWYDERHFTTINLTGILFFVMPNSVDACNLPVEILICDTSTHWKVHLYLRYAEFLIPWHHFLDDTSSQIFPRALTDDWERHPFSATSECRTSTRELFVYHWITWHSLLSILPTSYNNEIFLGSHFSKNGHFGIKRKSFFP